MSKWCTMSHRWRLYYCSRNDDGGGKIFCVRSCAVEIFDGPLSYLRGTSILIIRFIFFCFLFLRYRWCLYFLVLFPNAHAHPHVTTSPESYVHDRELVSMAPAKATVCSSSLAFVGAGQVRANCGRMKERLRGFKRLY